jgi:bifunctional non-homologous end joining protein LigD
MAKTVRTARAPASSSGRSAKTETNEYLFGLQKSPFPGFVEPMLSTLIPQPFDDADWIFEIKWDGYRAIGSGHRGSLSLTSRENTDLSRNYPEIVQALKNWDLDIVVDGEIVVVDDEGKADFNALEAWNRDRQGQLVYYVFDIIWYQGYDLKGLPLIKRKELLRGLLPQNDSPIQYVDYLEKHGKKLFRKMKENGLEGIVAKRKESFYLPAVRTREWLKITTHIIQEFVFGGWVESEKGAPFKSLLFGYYNKGKLVYYHHCGHGWKQNEMAEMLKAFKTIEIEESPFCTEVDYPGIKHWMRPVLVGEVKITRIGKNGKIRHGHPPVLQGWSRGVDPGKVTVDTLPWLKKQN